MNSMRYRRGVGAVALLATLLVVGCAGPAEAATKRLLVVGDSWAGYVWEDRSFSQVFDDFGFTSVEEAGQATALPGTTASFWKQPGNLAIIGSELAANPTIDMVHLSLGGNDFLTQWNVNQTPAQQQAIFDQVTADLQVIVDYILAQRPGVRVVIASYDYLNFFESVANNPAAQVSWAILGLPSARQLNDGLVGLSRAQQAVATRTARVEFVLNLGLMQWVYGYPAFSVPANTAPFPGQAPNYAPFPGGLIDLPSPPAAMDNPGGLIDPIHLSFDGYYYYAYNAVAQYYAPWLQASLPAKATNPSPGDGAGGISRTPALAWDAGAGATSHNVYFGPNGNLSFRANVAGTSFVPGTLNYSTNYAWRIDTVNGAGQVTTGDVWTFTVRAQPKSGCGTVPAAGAPVAMNAQNALLPLVPMVLALLVWGLMRRRATS